MVQVYTLYSTSVQTAQYKCADCTVQVYRLYSTGVQTVQYKCTDCTVQVTEVGQKISGLKNI